jgi:hypothetical protein
VAAIAGDGARNRTPRLSLSASKSKTKVDTMSRGIAKALVVSSLGLVMAGRGYSTGDHAGARSQAATKSISVVRSGADANETASNSR